MTEEENQLLIEHARAIAKILYKDAPVEELTSLGKIEEVVRSQMQEHVLTFPVKSQKGCSQRILNKAQHIEPI